MANPGQELSSINFSNMIGSPLRAVIEAQAEAALSTVNFIKSVGFKQGSSTDPEAGNTGDPIYVTFKYPKELAPFQPATTEQKQITIANAGAGITASSAVTFTPAGPAANAAAKSDGTLDTITFTSAPSAAGTWQFSVVGTTPATGSITYAPAQVAVPAQVQQMNLEVPILTILPIPFIRIEEFSLQFNAKIDSMESEQIEKSTAVAGNLQVAQRWPGGSARLSVSA